ncbi:NAD-dependent epimerase/dehydratase family protein [Lentzea sp. DG1S-22]|uniref:NAD-dependent epimerase/dehydratase family protein n=1 Tax=Lentzea sp. DG1S-22 TaxID=3108822 RepID=UPI002E77ED8A|nr:NAD-dependent epimerase/dehydratase family protein [Lentzea sp. DG1S-22]WVH82373.1 NAD-dependent epimerase/dehydratase family protein [Lentzea sp. DG1S-22]
MNVVVVTGSAGLVGSEAVDLFSRHFDLVIGMDNGMRQRLFGADAAVTGNLAEVERLANYRHHVVDIRDHAAVAAVLSEYGSDVKLVVHTAGQPSHEWATDYTLTDFAINAQGTLNVLEAVRQYCSDAVVVITSTNKVYGSAPNDLPLVETGTRWEVDPGHPYREHGIDESMNVDQTDHTFFGVSKLAADIAAQEYGRRLGMKVGIFRCSCLTGPRHAGVALHGFLSHLTRSAVRGTPYTIIGHHGKQVRDNLDARDLAEMFLHFYRNPRPGEVYHAGGGRERSCSVLEAISRIEQMTGRELAVKYEPQHRFADAKWWITDTRKFRQHYPEWEPKYSLDETLASMQQRWTLAENEDAALAERTSTNV